MQDNEDRMPGVKRLFYGIGVENFATASIINVLHYVLLLDPKKRGNVLRGLGVGLSTLCSQFSLLC